MCFSLLMVLCLFYYFPMNYSIACILGIGIGPIVFLFVCLGR